MSNDENKRYWLRGGRLRTYVKSAEGDWICNFEIDLGTEGACVGEFMVCQPLSIDDAIDIVVAGGGRRSDAVLLAHTWQNSYVPEAQVIDRLLDARLLGLNFMRSFHETRFLDCNFGSS